MPKIVNRKLVSLLNNRKNKQWPTHFFTWFSSFLSVYCSSPCDGISPSILIVSDELPLNLTKILLTGIYPDVWKLENVTPIHKKSDKQLIKKLPTYIIIPYLWEII